MKLKEMFFCHLGYMLCELAFKTDCWGPFKHAYRAGCWCYGKADEYRNCTPKFRTQQEAFDFIQRSYEESGGPNAEIREMRRRYEEINRARQAKPR